MMTKINQNLKSKYRGSTAEQQHTLQKLCFFSQRAQNFYNFGENLKNFSNRSLTCSLPANNLQTCVANFVGRGDYLKWIESAFRNKKIVVFTYRIETSQTGYQPYN